MVCGLGTSNCIYVPSDKAGRMITSELERLIREEKAKGKYPIMVNANAGTTVFGAFDPINDIADICKKCGLWLHVDVSNDSIASTLSQFIVTLSFMAWSASFLLSHKHRTLY
jgi:cysteine sulfinate desulfinase/cysteine desulfurase-like protein